MSHKLRHRRHCDVTKRFYNLLNDTHNFLSKAASLNVSEGFEESRVMDVWLKFWSFVSNVHVNNVKATLTFLINKVVEHRLKPPFSLDKNSDQQFDCLK